MSEIDDRASKEQASTAQEQELVRNLLHRIAADGTVDFNLLQYVAGMSATLGAALIKGPEHVVAEAYNDAVQHQLIHGYPGMQIIVFDILLSLNAPTVITLEDAAGVNLLSPMYAPNAGQGYTMNSTRGKHLPWDKGLYVNSTNAVQYGIDISYCLIER